jgi:hypothetical protein
MSPPTSLMATIAVICVLSATNLTRGEEATTNNKAQEQLNNKTQGQLWLDFQKQCKKYSDAAKRGITLSQDEQTVYTQCILSGDPPQPLWIDPNTGLPNSEVYRPPSVYLKDGCYWDNITHALVQCLM